jgi:hypothetical protein
MQKKISQLIILGVCILATFSLSAQNGTNSPYTRYGYGDLANRSFGAGRSMGGVGVGLRSSKQINPMNPASYSSMDSLTFLFDFGASAQMSRFNDGTNKQRDFNGNVEYMAMQFPLFKQGGLSVGLLPYSAVGYRYGEDKSSNGQNYTEIFYGSGGLNQLYSGLSIEVWKKRLSIGANINYVFGSIAHNSLISYPSGSNLTNLGKSEFFRINQAAYDFGLQYVHPLSKTDHLTVGLTYTPKKQMKIDTYDIVDHGQDSSIDTIAGVAFDLPLGYGFGASYVRENKFIAAADFSFQEWKDVSFHGKPNQFGNRSKISAGVEFIPNLFSRPYYNRMRYRAGVNYTNSYILINGGGYKEYGATAGVGFPISDHRSFINLSIDYVNIRPDVKTLISESYLRMTVSFTFNEYWFFKMRMN